MAEHRCTTHHHACDCREAHFADLEAELADICTWLRGIPGPDGSRLDGDGGLVAAVMRAHDQYERENEAMRKVIVEAVEAVNATINRLDNEDAYPVYFLMIHLQRIAFNLEKVAKEGK